LTSLIPIIQFFYNLFLGNRPNYRFHQNLFLMFLGVPMSINKITDKYTPLEHFSLVKTRGKSEIHKKIVLIPNTEPAQALKDLKQFARKNKIKQIWMSPLHPFIVSIVVVYILWNILAI
jgi:hypothetical protein